MELRRGQAHLIVWIYAFTGAVCLVYEVIALRLLRLELGSTTYATTAVLCTFMGGMALGSAIAASRADSSPNPLRAYAFLTFGAAISFALFPLLLAAARRLYPFLCGAAGGG